MRVTQSLRLEVPTLQVAYESDALGRKARLPLVPLGELLIGENELQRIEIGGDQSVAPKVCSILRATYKPRT